jgi:hypothetical protein
VVLNQASNGNVRIVVDTEDTDRMLHRWISGAELEAIQQQPPVQPSTETVAKPITVVEGAQDPVPEPPKRRGFFGRGK